MWKGQMLILLAENDPVVKTATNLEFFENLKTSQKTKFVFPHFKHELVNDLDRSLVFDKIRSFLMQTRAHSGTA